MEQWLPLGLEQKRTAQFSDRPPMERMRPGETEKTRHNNSSLDMVTVDSNVETSDDLGRAEDEKEITAAGSSSEERESGNFTFKSRIADLNTSGPGAKV